MVHKLQNPLEPQIGILGRFLRQPFHIENEKFMTFKAIREFSYLFLRLLIF